jgi:hypothetical protein
MGSIKLKQFYPENGVTDAVEATANYTAIEGSTAGLNAENVTSQALERDHFSMNGLHIKDSGWQTNGYELALGATVATDAKYPTVSNSNPTAPDPSVTNLFANLIYIVNHDENGVDSNVYGKGTKIPVGGLDGSNANGIALNPGDVVHIFWSVNCWAFDPQHTNTIVDYPCILIDTARSQGTIMDHSFVFYPRLNCVDGQPLESNFKKLGDATYGLSNDTWDEPADGVIEDTATNPSRCASGTIGGNGVKAFSNGNRKDHWSWTPLMLGAGGNASTKEDLAFQFDGPTGNVLGANELGGPRLHCGEIYIEVDNTRTLYGIQLYTTGAVTTHKQSPSQDPQERNGVTIEDNAVISSQGGFDGDLSIESTSIGYIIYRRESV